MILDVLNYLDDTVSERCEKESLNLMIFPDVGATGLWGRNVNYLATNVTVGAVLQEATRQTGLTNSFIAEATFVGTPETLRRILSAPQFSMPTNQRLATQLNQRLAIWDGCQANIWDIAQYLKSETGIKLDPTEAKEIPLLFCYRPNTRNMKMKNFIWWLALLSGTEVFYVDDTVKLRSKKSTSSLTVDAFYVKAVCDSEYKKMCECVVGKASSVSFRIEPAGTLISKTQFEKDKARQQAQRKSGDVLPTLLSLGNDYPDIGLRATCNVWTDGESITFTTADEVFDVQAKLLFEAGRTPIDLKQLARNICKQYDKSKPAPSDSEPSPIDPFSPAK